MGRFCIILLCFIAIFSGEFSYGQHIVQKKKTSFSNSDSWDTTLSIQEKILDKKLDSLRTAFVLQTEQRQQPLYNNTFAQLRPSIETSTLFKIFSQMPKGGLLHSHSNGMALPDWLISYVKDNPKCYVFTQTNNTSYIYGQLAVFKQTAPEGFIRLQDYLNSSPDHLDSLRALLTLERNNLSDYTDYWIEFEKRFQRVSLLLKYRPVFQAYYREAFEELLNDHVQHVEIRYIFGGLYDDDNTDLPADTEVADLKNLEKEIQKTHPEFTVKLIYTSLKFLDSTAILKQLQEAFRLKKKYPNVITGFDLVANEATGHTIAYFDQVWKSIPSLEKKFGIQMPLYLHAGESCSLNNHNVQEIPYTINKRIGHALNIAYFPETLRQAKLANNLVEVSPISNQILGYVSDLRNHPARVLLANKVPISINSDDPSIYNYAGLSYDFWMVYMNWNLNLSDLKQLIFNSIAYSSLKVNEKKIAFQYLNTDWQKFIFLYK